MGQSQPAMAAYLQWKIWWSVFSQARQIGKGSPWQHAQNVLYEWNIGAV